MDPLESMWRTYETVNDWIKVADAKSATILGAEGVLVGFIATRGPRGVLCNWAYVGVSALFYLVSLLTAYFCVRCINPRLDVGEPTSIIFFRHVAESEGGASDYVTSARATWSDDEKASEDLCGQIWANSRVAIKKHLWVKRAIWAFLASIILAAGIAFF